MVPNSSILPLYCSSGMESHGYLVKSEASLSQRWRLVEQKNRKGRRQKIINLVEDRRELIWLKNNRKKLSSYFNANSLICLLPEILSNVYARLKEHCFLPNPRQVPKMLVLYQSSPLKSYCFFVLLAHVLVQGQSEANQ